MEPIRFTTPAEYWHNGQKSLVIIYIEASDGRIFVDGQPVRISLKFQLRLFVKEETFYLVYDDQHPPKPIVVMYRELTQVVSAQA